MNRLTEPDYSVIDCTGVQLGNTDIEEYSAWTGWDGPKERPPLLGLEHEAALKERTWREA